MKMFIEILLSFVLSVVIISMIWIVASIEHETNMWTYSTDLTLCYILCCILGTPICWVGMKIMEILDK